jgi:hypothetical protein
MVTPGPPACNVTYTKTVTTITLEPTGNVTKVETYNYVVPCADAPGLPPVGAPDSEPMVTRTMRTIPQSDALQTSGADDGVAYGPDAALPPDMLQVDQPRLQDLRVPHAGATVLSCSLTKLCQREPR